MALRLVTYNNRPYPIIIRKKKKGIIAEINVHGAVGKGDTEEEAVQDLRVMLGKMEQSSNRGKDKLLLG